MRVISSSVTFEKLELSDFTNQYIPLLELSDFPNQYIPIYHFVPNTMCTGTNTHTRRLVLRRKYCKVGLILGLQS